MFLDGITIVMCLV